MAILRKYQNGAELDLGSGRMNDPKILKEVTVYADRPDWAKAKIAYQKENPYEDYLYHQKEKYINKSHGGLNKLYNISQTNFPEDVEEKIRNDYQYDMDNAISKSLGKTQGFNPKKRGEWVEGLTSKEREIIANSRYGSKLQPSLLSRSAAGLKKIATTILPYNQDLKNLTVPGLTKKEAKETQNSWMGGAEAFSALDAPGAILANLGKNSRKEQPSIFSGELMANVDETDAALLNPALITGVGGMASGVKLLTKVPKLVKRFPTSQVLPAIGIPSYIKDLTHSLKKGKLLGKNAYKQIEVPNTGKPQGLLYRPSDNDITLFANPTKSEQLGMTVYDINKEGKPVGYIGGTKLSNGDFEAADVEVDPKFQKQGIAGKAYNQLNNSLPEGNKVKSWGAFVEDVSGTKPGEKLWESLEKQNLAQKNPKGIYEMIPSTFQGLPRGNNKIKAGVPKRGKPQGLLYKPSNNLTLKSIEDGSSLEKQLSKTGEININNLTAHIGKAETSKPDKYILQKVLNEKFAGEKSINYNGFKNSISDELVPLQISKTSAYAPHGVDRLNLSSSEEIKTIQKEITRIEGLYSNIYVIRPIENNGKFLIDFPESTISKSIKKEFNTLEEANEYLANREGPLVKASDKRNELVANLTGGYRNLGIKENQTLTFSNTERFGKGSADHFDENTLGHTRYLVTNKEPNVFHNLETQSDLFQKNKLNPINMYSHQLSLGRMESLQNNNKKVLENMKKTGLDPQGIKVEQYQIKQFEDIIKGQEQQILMAKAGVANFEQKQLLGDKHLERLLQENVDFASKNGQTIMRYPTSETVAKIQGYKKSVENHKVNLKTVQDRINKYKVDEIDKINNDKKLLDNLRKEYEANPLEEVYTLEHQTILKKADDAPKMIKKVLNIRTEIKLDSKSNNWYEFDVPESFKQGKGKIRALGLIPAVIGTGLLNKSNNTIKTD